MEAAQARLILHLSKYHIVRNHLSWLIYLWHFTDSAVGKESDCRSRGSEFDCGPVHTFVQINDEIMSMIILLLPLIQEGLLSVTSKICATALSS